MGVAARGILEAQQRLAEVQARLRDLRPVLEVAGADLVALTDDSFREERSPDGVPWAPLSPVTLAKRRGSTASILTDTSRLRSSITYQAGPRSLRFGTNAPYAAPNQDGAMIRPWGRGEPRQLPARPFMPARRSAGRYVPMAGGAAGQLWDRIRASVRTYVTTGELR